MPSPLFNKISWEPALAGSRYQMWFEQKTSMVASKRNTLNIGVANAFAADWIRTKFLHDTRAAARDVCEQDIEVRVVAVQKPGDYRTLYGNRSPPPFRRRPYRSASIHASAAVCGP